MRRENQTPSPYSQRKGENYNQNLKVVENSSTLWKNCSKNGHGRPSFQQNEEISIFGYNFSILDGYKVRGYLLKYLGRPENGSGNQI